MKKYFVTAAGTGIGKTFVTTTLARSLYEQDRKVVALKPVISGFDPQQLDTSDTGLLLKAQGLPVTQANANVISPWQFFEPISPNMAAENEGKLIHLSELVAFCQKHENRGYLLVEGVGGVMTPIGNDYTVLDWMAALGYEVILVSGSYLGALSHTLTAYKAITAQKLKLHSMIISESEISPVPLARTLLTLKRFLPNNLLTYSITRTDKTTTLTNSIL